MAKGFPAGIVTLVVGCVAASVAWQQISRGPSKLKLDVFQKRYATIEKKWARISEAILTGPGPTPLPTFDNVISQAGFLFGPDVEFLKEISSKRSELWTVDYKTIKSGSLVPPKNIQRHSTLVQLFYNEASFGAQGVFGPWLDFKNWN
jgi:hypothetical protein